MPGDVQRLKLLIEPHPATLRNDKDLMACRRSGVRIPLAPQNFSNACLALQCLTKCLRIATFRTAACVVCNAVTLVGGVAHDAAASADHGPVDPSRRPEALPTILRACASDPCDGRTCYETVLVGARWKGGMGVCQRRRKAKQYWRCSEVVAAPASQRPGPRSGRAGEGTETAILPQPAHRAKLQFTAPAASSEAVHRVVRAALPACRS
jgi:hypothetical protein